VHTLGGPLSTETYGIVEFLRTHTTWRCIAGALGFITFALAFIGWGFTGWGLDFKIAGLTVYFLPLLIMGSSLLYVATISGKHFEVTFPPIQAAQEREKAERDFEQSKTVADALKLDLSRLNEYYVINQSQARSSFRWAVFSMLLGFGTIISGIWLFYFRGAQPNVFMASLSTAAGFVVNLVSALFLHLHSKIQERSLHYYEQLARLQNLSIAIRLVESHEEPTARQEARNLVIRELVSGVRLLPRSETAKPIAAIKGGSLSAKVEARRSRQP
jgi:hypothetical protein